MPSKDFEVTIEKTGVMWKLEKRNYYCSEFDSVIKHGSKEFKCAAGASMVKTRAERNVSKILNKYMDGIRYIACDWRGNDALNIGMLFQGEEESTKSESTKKERKTFECLSNELILDDGFKEKTKGIEAKV